MIQQATDQYRHTANKFIDLLTEFPDEQFNTAPFAGSWTPAQVGEHILKSLTGTPDMLNAKAEPATRDAGEKEQAIKDVFLDFEARYKSPEYIIPSDNAKDKAELTASLRGIAEQILTVFKTNKPDEICTGYEVPGFGPFTRLEWLYLFTYHTQRHIWQLQKMQN